MRELLLERVRPLVAELAEDLASLAVDRVEAELGRMREAFAVALSAYQSDEAAAKAVATGAQIVALAQQHKVFTEEDLPLPEPSKPARGRVSPVRDREDRGKKQANGKNAPTCSACGFVGGNARGCGRAHPTLGAPPPKPARAPGPSMSAGALEAARANRLESIRTSSNSKPPGRSGQPPALGMRSPAPVASSRGRLPTDPIAVDDQDDDEIERWPADRIADEAAKAEAAKKPGELPVPRASFNFRGGL